LLERKILEKYDSSGMHKAFDQWTKIVRNTDQSDLKSVDHVKNKLSE